MESADEQLWSENGHGRRDEWNSYLPQQRSHWHRVYIECPELERCVGQHKPFIMCFVLWGLLVDRNPLFPHAVNLNWVDKLRDSYRGGKMPPLSGHCLAPFSGGPQTGPIFLNHEKDKLINHRGWDQKEGLPLPTATVLASNSLMVFS